MGLDWRVCSRSTYIDRATEDEEDEAHLWGYVGCALRVKPNWETIREHPRGTYCESGDQLPINYARWGPCSTFAADRERDDGTTGFTTKGFPPSDTLTVSRDTCAQVCAESGICNAFQLWLSPYTTGENAFLSEAKKLCIETE